MIVYPIRIGGAATHPCFLWYTGELRLFELLEQLVHNGVVVPEPPEPVGLTLRIRGREVRLTPRQEEMVLAWARKKDTEYVQDPVFAANFMQDLSAELGVEPPLTVGEVDWSPAYDLVDAERAAKESLTKEERKALAAQRRAAREALKARYGYAIVNGQRVELGTYMTEPSGIFMGRGQHPLRGRWKEGAAQEDVTLNLSPDAPRPEGNWAEIVWQPESMWVARWPDRLSGKLKYIWLSDTAPIKQQREARKFDQAVRLSEQIDRVRAEIRRGLQAESAQRRKLATACYLIDALCLRVGDEKDPDEADTVGATTLRPEHVTPCEDGEVEFRFLGKDSVEWHKRVRLPEVVLENLRELIANARPSVAAQNGAGGHPTRDLPQLFPDVTSRDVNAFLSGILRGLTAKVFRTHHATVAVQESLEGSGLTAADPEYRKWEAASLANLEAAVLCNHTKKPTGDWAARRKRFAERVEKARDRIARYRQQQREYRERLAALRVEAREREAAANGEERAARVRERYRKRLAVARRRLDAASQRRQRAEDALGKIRAQEAIAGEKRNWNLTTSLKSYIDPRVYHRWGKAVHYDVLQRYYPATLRRKFLWVRAADDAEGSAGDDELTVRPCMASDVGAVVALLSAVKDEYPALDVPLTREAVEECFLPALEKPWCEALIALDEDDHLLAFAALGPEWTSDDEDLVDVLAIAHPHYTSEALARRVAEHLKHRLAAHNVQFPRKEMVLRPRRDDWVEYMPEMAGALGLLDTEEGEVDDGEDEG